jgi:hypothetical protein
VNIHNNQVLRGTTARPPFGQKIVPIFWPGQSPTLGPGKLPQGKVFSGKYLPEVNIHNNEVL